MSDGRPSNEDIIAITRARIAEIAAGLETTEPEFLTNHVAMIAAHNIYASQIVAQAVQDIEVRLAAKDPTGAAKLAINALWTMHLALGGSEAMAQTGGSRDE